MMELRGQNAIQCSSMTEKRLAYLKQCERVRLLWIAQNRRLGSVTLLNETEVVNGKHKIKWVCDCGNRGSTFKSGLIRSIKMRGWFSCYACANKKKAVEFSKTDKGKKHLAKITAKATISTANRFKHTQPFRHLLSICICAKQRCTNVKNVGYKNYGGRGIKFLFDTPISMAEWIYVNLGDRPSANHSIDRIDNNRHYEAGNLRWATRSEQNANKRAYKVGPLGERIKRLQAMRPDYCYETIRLLIKKGLTDEEIRSRKKWG